MESEILTINQEKGSHKAGNDGQDAFNDKDYGIISHSCHYQAQNKCFHFAQGETLNLNETYSTAILAGRSHRLHV